MHKKIRISTKGMFRENILLSRFASYKIGGPARYFFDTHQEKELIEALGAWREMSKSQRSKKLPLFILGGGTNLLISDEGFPGLVLKSSIDFIDCDETTIRVGSGTLMEDVIRFSVFHELSGLEWAGGLPGSLGGAVRGNAGAFGGEMKDSIDSVSSIAIETGETRTRNRDECEFGYRSSIFKTLHGKEIITSVTLHLKKGVGETIERAVKEKILYRTERHPMEYPNIGSIFKNVPVTEISDEVMPKLKVTIKSDPFPVVPTAYLISETGLRGVSYGGAMISPKHPNFIVNTCAASAEDVRALIDLVKSEVKSRFGILLKEEIEILSGVHTT